MYTRDDSADTNGCHLVETFGPVTGAAVRRAFGVGLPSCEPDKGYGTEYAFRGPGGVVVTLYDRYGAWRVGARTDSDGMNFFGWVEERLGLVPPSVDSSAGTYDPATRTLSVDASDHPIADGGPPAVWVRSHRTGKLAQFDRVATVRDADGDVTHWDYRNREHAMTLRVFND